MFIGIVGSIGSGRSSVAEYLVRHQGFTYVYITSDQNPVSDKNTTTEEPTGPDPTTTQSASQSADLTPESLSALLAADTLPTRLLPHKSLSFPTPEALLTHVTKNYTTRWVTTTLPSTTHLDLFSRRPFFLLLSVDAPLLLRHQRIQSKLSLPSLPLTTFASHSDTHLYHAPSLAASTMSRATVSLLNTSPTLTHLHTSLSRLDLINPDRLRPSWDTYFMALASLAALRSNCMKRRVGCVLVRANRVLSTGYNGTPRGLLNCIEGGCARCNAASEGSGHGLTTCLCLHAEENALLEAGRERIREGAILYCDTCPCLTCSIKIAQVGIREVVYAQGYSMDGETAAVFREAGVRLRQFVPPAKGLIHLEGAEGELDTRVAENGGGKESDRAVTDHFVVTSGMTK